MLLWNECKRGIRVLSFADLHSCTILHASRLQVDKIHRDAPTPLDIKNYRTLTCKCKFACLVDHLDKSISAVMVQNGNKHGILRFVTCQCLPPQWWDHGMFMVCSCRHSIIKLFLGFINLVPFWMFSPWNNSERLFIFSFAFK